MSEAQGVSAGSPAASGHILHMETIPEQQEEEKTCLQARVRAPQHKTQTLCLLQTQQEVKCALICGDCK